MMGALVVLACTQKQGRIKLGELGVRKGGHVIIHQHKELSLSLSSLLNTFPPPPAGYLEATCVYELVFE